MTFGIQLRLARWRADWLNNQKCHGTRPAQRPALQLPPRRAVKTVKIGTISRAEGGQLQAPVGRSG